MHGNQVIACDCERSQDIWFCTCEKANPKPENETDEQMIERHLDRIKQIQKQLQTIDKTTLK